MAMLTAAFFVVFSAIFFTSPLAVLTVGWFDVLFTAFNGIGLFILPLWIHVFPSGRFVFSWIRWVFLALLALAISAAVFPIVQPVYMIAGFAIGLTGLAAQFYRYRRLATAVERQQLKWLLLAFSGRSLY